MSVVVPNYNHAPYLEQRLESILAQTYAPFELIVLDDASTDESAQIIARYATSNRLQVERNATNSGSPFVQWNRGVALARGEWVWIAESDDYAEPTFLHTLVDLAQANSDCVLAYSQSWRVDRNGKILGTMADEWDSNLQPERWKRPFVNAGADECAHYMIWKNTIPNASGAIFRRAAYLSVGGASTTMRLCGDWMLWAQLLKLGDIAYTPAPLNFFRYHPTTVRAGTAWAQHVREQWLTRSYVLRSCPVPRAIRREIARLTFAQMMDQVLPSPAGSRLRMLRSCLSICGPVLRQSPLGTLEAILRRLGQTAACRLSPTSTKS